MEFTINNHEYVSGKLDTFQQLFIVKRISKSAKKALNEDLIGMATKIANKEEVDYLKLAAEAAGAFGSIPDEDLSFIITECAKVVKRKQGTNYAPIYSGGTFMFQDMDSSEYLIMSFNVLKENLRNFFNEFLSTLGMSGKEMKQD